MSFCIWTRTIYPLLNIKNTFKLFQNKKKTTILKENVNLNITGVAKLFISYTTYFPNIKYIFIYFESRSKLFKDFI